MTTLNLKLDLKNTKIQLNDKDKEKISFIVTKVFNEYIEDLDDTKLSKQIKESKELDSIISNVKF